SVLRSLGGSSFTLDPYVTVAGSGLYSLVSADINLDNYTDIVTLDTFGNQATVLLNNNVGTFTQTAITTGTSPLHIAKGDLNNDGYTDVVVANNGQAAISILLANGVGLNGAITVNLPAGSETPTATAIGDIDNDGIVDIVVADPATQSVLLLKGNGLGGVASQSVYALPAGAQGPVSISLGDVNGDGKLDIVTANDTTGNITVFINSLLIPGVF
ncbi:MAG: VCBS repeat-containing protein, partial [Ghiorsea sp.]